MIKKISFVALLVVLTGFWANTSSASLVLLINDSSTLGPDVVVIDNAPAGTTSSGGAWVSTVDDSNSTLGGVVFNGGVGDFEINVSTGVSKPLLHHNQIDLNSVVASFSSARAEIFMVVLDTDFVDNGQGFRTEIGGTTNGVVLAETYVSPGNGDADFDFDPVSGNVFFDSPFMWQDDQQVSVGSTFAMAGYVLVRHENPGISSFDLHFQQVPEPTTALIWTMLAGVGLVTRRRRSR
ncbi:MAG: hypothetical protein MK108_11310 [Mariniblastus sp.]|nr:hypothetical protein [Mariniblastus sp.]